SEYYTADKVFTDYPLVTYPDEPSRDHIDPRMMAEDLERLRAQDEVLTYVQTTVAHRVAARSDEPTPTFGEFHNAIQVLHEVFHRYYVLLTNISPSFEPTTQYDVFEPFLKPWIVEPNQFDARLCR